MNDNYNGIINDSPNRTNQSPTNHGDASRPSSRANNNGNSNNHNMNQQTNSNHHQHHQQQQQQSQTNNNGGSSPHSPLGSDTMLAGNNYDNLRSMLGSSSLDGAMLNGINNSNSGVNDIMLGAGLGSDSNCCSKLISSSSPAHQTSLMMSTSSPSHPLTQTTTAIPEIIFSGESQKTLDILLQKF